MTLEDVFLNTIQLGNVRTSGCQFLCRASLIAQGQGQPEDRVELDKMLRHFKEARDWLKSGLISSIEPLANGTSLQALHSVLDAAREDIDKIIDRMSAILNNVESDQTATIIREVMDKHIDQLSTHYQAVITEVDTIKHDVEKNGQSETREVVDAALGELDQINSTINLIAVNASIEAARVGDQGRGFAVISTEIQDLSKKSRSVVEGIKANIA